VQNDISWALPGLQSFANVTLPKLWHCGELNACFRNIDRACDTWEQILYDHPTDAFVARLLHNGYYFLGANETMRDSVARILPEWPTSRPLYGYLLGMYAFGLCETKNFDKAAVMAHKASCSAVIVCLNAW